MTILSDKEIKELAIKNDMISPFEEKQIKTSNIGEKIISYGLSSFGYDVRLADEFKIFTNVNHSPVIDPKKFCNTTFVEQKNDFCIIPPNSFVLGRTIEYFKIPRNILTLCIGKSTYARCGIIVNVTPIEPQYEGNIVLEFSNTTPLPAKIYAGEGISQFIFFKGQKCQTSYADKNGKYMKQKGVETPKI